MARPERDPCTPLVVLALLVGSWTAVYIAVWAVSALIIRWTS